MKLPSQNSCAVALKRINPLEVATSLGLTLPMTPQHQRKAAKRKGSERVEGDASAAKRRRRGAEAQKGDGSAAQRRRRGAEANKGDASAAKRRRRGAEAQKGDGSAAQRRRRGAEAQRRMRDKEAEKKARLSAAITVGAARLRAAVAVGASMNELPVGASMNELPVGASGAADHANALPATQPPATAAAAAASASTCSSAATSAKASRRKRATKKRKSNEAAASAGVATNMNTSARPSAEAATIDDKCSQQAGKQQQPLKAVRLKRINPSEEATRLGLTLRSPYKESKSRATSRSSSTSKSKACASSSRSTRSKPNTTSGSSSRAKTLKKSDREPASSEFISLEGHTFGKFIDSLNPTPRAPNPIPGPSNPNRYTHAAVTVPSQFITETEASATSNQMTSTAPKRSNSNLQFSNIDHWQIMSELVAPVQVSKNQTRRFHYKLFYKVGGPSVKVYMRFSRGRPLEDQTPNCGAVGDAQERAGVDTTVKINGSALKIRKRNCPVDITSSCEFPQYRNDVALENHITVTSKKAYFVTVVLVRYHGPRYLLTMLHKKEVKRAKETETKIRASFKKSDESIEIETRKISLICPLSKTRIRDPCKSQRCDHIECFDAKSYIELNAKSQRWICPFCNRKAPFETLHIDGYFKDVLEEFVEDVEEILVDNRGRSRRVQKEKETDSIATENEDLVITLEDDDESVTDRRNRHAQKEHENEDEIEILVDNPEWNQHVPNENEVTEESVNQLSEDDDDTVLMRLAIDDVLDLEATMTDGQTSGAGGGDNGVTGKDNAISVPGDNQDDSHRDVDKDEAEKVVATKTEMTEMRVRTIAVDDDDEDVEEVAAPQKPHALLVDFADEEANPSEKPPVVERFVCSFCEWVFNEEVSLQHHTHMYHTTSINCSYYDTCGKSFSTNHEMEQHVHEVHRTKKCPYYDTCGTKFTTNEIFGNIKQHLEQVHPIMKCPFYATCGRSFPTNGEMNEHIHQSHKKCSHFPSCREMFSSDEELRQHVGRVHSTVKCTYYDAKCGKTFATSKERREHELDAHMNEESRQSIDQVHPAVKCTYYNTCRKTFPTDEEMKEHQLRAHMKCPVFNSCRNVFSSDDEVNVHVQQIHKCKAPQCKDKHFLDLTSHNYTSHFSTKKCRAHKFCGKSFSTNEQLKVHEDQIHKCKESACNNSFYNDLKTHTDRFHSGVKCTYYDMCGKIFPTNEEMEEHELQSHMKCPCPGFNSSREKFSSNLNHLKFVHRCKEPQCNNNIFIDLKNHNECHSTTKKNHNNECHSTTKCPGYEFCGKTFSTDAELNVHKEQIHNCKKRACNNSFFADLKTHNQFYHGDWSDTLCNTCGEIFTCISLANHTMREHHAIWRLTANAIGVVCQICKRKFGTPIALMSHTKDTHKTCKGCLTNHGKDNCRMPRQPEPIPTRIEPPVAPTQPHIVPLAQLRIQPPAQPRIERVIRPSSEPPAQPQVQPPAQLHVQPPAQPQVQLQAQPQVQPPAQLQIQPLAQLQPPAQPHVQPQAQPQVQPLAQLQVQLPAQLQVQPQVQPHVQLQVQPLAQLQVQPLAQLQVQPLAQLQVQPLAQLQVQLQVQPHVRLQVQSPAQPQVQPSAQLQVQPSAQSQVQPPAQLQVQPLSQPQVQLQVQPHVQLQVQPPAQPKVQPQVQPPAQPHVQLPAQPCIESPPQLRIESPTQPHIKPATQSCIKPETQPRIEPTQPRIEPAQPRIHPEESYSCRCGMIFRSESARGSHVCESRQDCSEPPPDHRCTSCGGSFASESDLVQHIESIHRRKTLHGCPKCGNQYPTSTILVTHLFLDHKKKEEQLRASSSTENAQPKEEQLSASSTENAQLPAPLASANAQLPAPLASANAQLPAPLASENAQLPTPLASASVQLAAPSSSKSSQLPPHSSPQLPLGPMYSQGLPPNFLQVLKAHQSSSSRMRCRSGIPVLGQPQGFQHPSNIQGIPPHMQGQLRGRPPIFQNPPNSQGPPRFHPAWNNWHGSPYAQPPQAGNSGGFPGPWM